MKILARCLSVGLMILVLAGLTAFGATQNATVSFAEDTNVGGTMVKAGEYRVRFNEETKEFTVMKGSKVLAKTTATLVDRTDKAPRTTLHFKNNELVSVTFSGERQDVVLGGTASTNGSDQ